MDLNYSPEEAAFEREVREFIGANLPDDIARKVELDLHLDREDYMRWQQILGRKGWLAYTWPKEYGGAQWSAVQRYIFEAVSAELNCPTIQPFGPRMVGPVIYTFGTPEQQERFLPGIRDSTVWWCQGYSEPASGSDLASLSLRADDAGDHYVLNGQKIWTSYAHHADWMFCLVRTSREARPQSGISFVLLDMRTPGVQVEPILMLGGEHSFNSVFFNEVRVPKENLIGEEGKGWTYAKFLLENERVENSNIGFSKMALRKLKNVAAKAQANGQPLLHDPNFSARVTAIETQLKALEIVTLRALSDLDKGNQPGPGISSLLKIRGTEIGQHLTELAMQAAGPQAVAFQREILFEGATTPSVVPDETMATLPTYLFRRSMSIYGGSNEIQRNIIAKHVLGL